MELEPHEQAILDRTLELLADRPMPVVELTQKLADEGVFAAVEGADDTDLDDLADYLDELLMTTDDTWTSDDDWIGSVTQVLGGRPFTHRVTAQELADEAITTTPDLAHIDFDLVHRRESLTLVTGGDVAFSTGADATMMAGPAGWLAAFQAGDLLVFTRSGDTLTVVSGSIENDGHDEARALWESFDAHREEREDAIEVPLLLLDILVSDPARMMFTQVIPPMAELLSLAGLECRDEWCGEVDVHWAPPMKRRDSQSIARLARNYEFDPCCTMAFSNVRTGWGDWMMSLMTDSEWVPSRLLLDDLDHGAVVEAFAEYIFDGPVGIGDGGVPLLDTFATAFVDAPGGERSAAGLYLRATNAELDGRVADMEADLEEGLRRDEDHRFSARSLADVVSDRGNAARAIALMTRAGFPHDSAVLRVLRAAAEPYRGVGRNDPCPCGSGRKFKTCCLRDPKNPIEARRGWMHQKVGSFVLRPRRRHDLFNLALSASSPDTMTIESVAALVQDPFIIDVATYEGGGLADYLAQRGALLPPDEFEVFGGWLSIPRRLWEVVRVDSGVGSLLRDVISGDEVTVVGVSGQQFGVADQIFARIAESAGVHALVGTALVVPIRGQEPLLGLLDAGYDADTLAAWYGWTLAPKRDSTTSMEDDEDLDDDDFDFDDDAA